VSVPQLGSEALGLEATGRSSGFSEAFTRFFSIGGYDSQWSIWINLLQRSSKADFWGF
jgi:hypothetical protein